MKIRDPDRVLRAGGPVAHHVRQLIFATMVLYALLAVAVVGAVVYYLNTNDKLERSISRLDRQDRQIREQQALISRLAVQGVEAHKGTCQYRDGLAESVAEAKATLARQQKFLDDVRAGRRPPIQGITDQDILAGIRTQQGVIDRLTRQIGTLSVLTCSPPKRKEQR